MNDPSIHPAPQRWAQFSLKTLMLLMLVAAAFFSGWAVAWRKGQEAEALARREAEMARLAEMDARVMAEQQRALAQQQLASTRLLTPGEQLQLAESPAAEIEAVLREQAVAWNAGDLDQFMEHYWKSDELTFSSGGQTTRGWQKTLDRYRQRYPTTEKMGRLTFDQLQVHPLGDAAALVLGRWQLTREGDMPGGNFSLVARKIDGRWVIVHDHTSQSEKRAEPPADGTETPCR